MSKRCPFVVMQECFGDKCAVWRVAANGAGYCGAGGAPSAEAVEAPAPAVMATQKQTTNGASHSRQKRGQ